ncbi:hypothetical protein ULG90_22560 [Halopseudomonas pachastrellae]|nr:hypothetical protein ULG90_22560 [Halopseudomonas pachastrellae]
MVAGNCRDRVSITEDALQLQPGDWLLALRQLEYASRMTGCRCASMAAATLKR